jgi:hypothetical protein
VHQVYILFYFHSLQCGLFLGIYVFCLYWFSIKILNVVYVIIPMYISANVCNPVFLWNRSVGSTSATQWAGRKLCIPSWYFQLKLLEIYSAKSATLSSIYYTASEIVTQGDTYYFLCPESNSHELDFNFSCPSSLVHVHAFYVLLLILFSTYY